MNLVLFSYFVTAVFGFMIYLAYGALDKVKITPLAAFMTVGVLLLPVVNVIFTFLSLSYLIHELIRDIGKYHTINKYNKEQNEFSRKSS